jgi:uncharacterized protein YceK
MNRLSSLVLLGLMLTCLGGCGTFLNFADFHGARPEFGDERIYGGVAIDFLAISEIDGVWTAIFVPLAMLIELPLSLVMDTLTLPITIPTQLGRD